MVAQVPIINRPSLTTSEFQQLASIVYSQCGINIVIGKKVLLESRLSKRLNLLNIDSFKAYIDFISSKEGIEKELVHMVDVVTTNKTDFFREPHHFEFMSQSVLPDYIQEFSGKPFKVWSAACSSGEEPYTLAMVLEDFAKLNPRFTYDIVASDISTQVLQKATLAVYPEHLVAGVPHETKRRYLLKSKDRIKPTVRIIPALRNNVRFQRVNLMDADWEIESELDAIFCRNVLIYFDRKTQHEVISKLIKKLKRGGLLFIGHSESLHQFDLPIKQVRPTIFIKK